VNRSLESLIRFVNLTASGLLAGSLGFGEAALVPGWQEELPHGHMRTLDALREINYFNAIGPVALAGVLAATVMVTVPINKELESQAPADYADDRSQSLTKNWARAHAVRTTLGISAFICAVAAGLGGARHAK